MLNRRSFSVVAASVPAPFARQSRPANGASPVLDLHFHLREARSCSASRRRGIAANLLTRDGRRAGGCGAGGGAGAVHLFYSAGVGQPAGIGALAQAVKSGARGFGEIKLHYATDGPEFRRAYALAADLDVPIHDHSQRSITSTTGKWSPGFATNFERILKDFPRTTFIGHADAFWANVSADYHNEAAYPSGPIVRGGITDKLLADYPNLYGDLSANSGNNMLSRDAEFTRDFLRRHQDKLMFGSDCGCTDGHGGGVSQGNNPAAARLVGKCVAERP
jgi:hypothetical protein